MLVHSKFVVTYIFLCKTRSVNRICHIHMVFMVCAIVFTVSLETIVLSALTRHEVRGIVEIHHVAFPKGLGMRKDLFKRLEASAATGLFTQFYGNNSDMEFQLNRYNNLLIHHMNLYSLQPHDELRFYSTAGRTELAGNHTDHNHGKVIAASINLDTIAAVSKGEKTIVSVISEGFEPVEVDYTILEPLENEKGTTFALVRGIVAGFAARGYAIGPFKAVTSTRVLKGSGLSSSAAIEMMCATILNDLYNDNRISIVDMAIICKEAENNYFGKPSGLMDQIACGNGGIAHIDFGNPERPKVTALHCDFQSHGYDLVVVDTKGNHADLTHEYAAVPDEMRAVASYFGASALREVEHHRFIDHVGRMRTAINNDRALIRAFHFLEENRRVDAMAEALMKQDIATYLELVQASGNSSFMFLQNLYSSSAVTDQPLPVALAATQSFLAGKGACRVHGGGFAGTIQSYIPRDMTKAYIAYMQTIFGNGCATVLAIRDVPTRRVC